jgi:hypothetical protein
VVVSAGEADAVQPMLVLNHAGVEGVLVDC